MQIDPFGVEQWMNEWETRCAFNLAETCVDSVTIAELLAIAGKNDTDLSALLPKKMTYGAIEGSDELRDAICRLYDSQRRENTIITHGTIGANMLVHKTLVGAGDHVIALVPTYQQHYSIPASIGADVEQLLLREDLGWMPDLDALRGLMRPDTKMIAINNPNNPTGALMPLNMLEEIAQIARDVGAYVLSDEVYRGTEQSGQMGPSMADVYEKGISTASVSKAFSLAGLRLGWIAGPEELIHRVAIHRDYDTISVGQLDDHFATMALQNADKILSRSLRIVTENLTVLSDWIDNEPAISWVRPEAGTTALLRYDFPMSSREFCVGLLDHSGVMLTPGSALNVEGYLRIGFANPTPVLRSGLDRLSGYLNHLTLK